MLAWRTAPPSLLVVIDPRSTLLPLRTIVASYVVDGLASLKPTSTLRREARPWSETTAVPVVAKRYPSGAFAAVAGASLKVHSSLLLVEDFVVVVTAPLEFT